MWTALFFPLGFDEVSHDSGCGKGQIETINNQTHLPATPLLTRDPHRQARIVEDRILYYDKAGYKVVEKNGDNEWDTQRTEAMHGQRRTNHVDSTLFPTGF